MRSSETQPSVRLQQVLQQFDEHGSVALPGSMSVPVARWVRVRRMAFRICAAIGGLGMLAMLVGLLLRDTGVWSLLIPAGAFLTFAGVVGVAVVSINYRLMRGRLSAEKQPVVLDSTGITVRGIGPIPWSDVEPPEVRTVRVKHDIGGRCTVLPLTTQGNARANQQLGSRTNLIGPRPYLNLTVPHLLLPGIDGLTEDETMQLFRTAYQRYAPGPGRPGSS